MTVLKHKMNPGFYREPAEPVLSARYLAEIEASLRRAEKACRAAEAALRRAEKKAERAATPANLRVRDEMREAVLTRLAELAEIERLMQPVATTTKKRVRIVNKGATL